MTEAVEEQKYYEMLLTVCVANCILNCFALIMTLGGIYIILFVWAIACLPFSIILANIKSKITSTTYVDFFVILYLLLSIVMLVLGFFLIIIMLQYAFGGESTRGEDRLLVIEIVIIVINFVLPFIIGVAGKLKYKFS